MDLAAINTARDAGKAGRRWLAALGKYAATMAVIAFGVWFYTRASQYHLRLFRAELPLEIAGASLRIRTTDLLAWLGFAYAVLLIPYYALLPRVVASAAVAARFLAARLVAAIGRWGFGRLVLGPAFGRGAFGRSEHQAFLALALKFFFIPLMFNMLLENAVAIGAHWHALTTAGALSVQEVFSTGFQVFILRLLLAVDVLMFTIGYVVEIPALGNEIKSVDPTLSGWAACVICYAPFNTGLSAFFPSEATDIPDFANPAVQAAMGSVVIASMAVFAWASVALGLRASNLTNRGIVRHGPYRWVRHPAYAAKNLVWWICAMPVLGLLFAKSIAIGLWAVACLAMWTLIYVLRALTEERHLLMLDNGYAQYMQQVRYRFIRGVF